MDPRQPQHAFTRPPERSLIHNPNHQPPQTSQSQPQPYGSYPPPAPQPHHVPFTADPYPSTRRDPFLPSASQGHARKGSYGMHGGEGLGERHGPWANTGTIYSRGSHFPRLAAAVQRVKRRRSGYSSVS